MRKRYLPVVTILILLLGFSPAYSAKGKYDKVTGTTEYRTQDMIARYNPLSGNMISFKFSALHSDEKKQTKVFIVFQSFQAVSLMEENTPLYLLIDDKKRVELEPVSLKTREPGGTATYWGFGVSTYRRNVVQKVAYELDPSLFQEICQATRVDAKLSDVHFDVEGWELKKVRELALSLQKEYPEEISVLKPGS